MFLSEKEGTGIKVSESDGTGINFSESEGTGIRSKSFPFKFLFSLMVITCSQFGYANTLFLYETKNESVYEGNLISKDQPLHVLGVINDMEFNGLINQFDSADDGTGSPDSADDGTGSPDSADDGTGSPDSADDGTGGSIYSADDGTGNANHSADDGTGGIHSADDGTGKVLTFAFECNQKNQFVGKIESEKYIEEVTFNSIMINNKSINCK